MSQQNNDQITSFFLPGYRVVRPGLVLDEIIAMYCPALDDITHARVKRDLSTGAILSVFVSRQDPATAKEFIHVYPRIQLCKKYSE